MINNVGLFKWKPLAEDMELNKGMSCQKASICIVKKDTKKVLKVIDEDTLKVKLDSKIVTEKMRKKMTRVFWKDCWVYKSHMKI